MRWTGSRRAGPAEPPLKGPGYLPRRTKGKNVFGVLILLLVLAGVWQYQWMKRIRQKGAKDVVPPVFAEQLSRWMLHKKGLDPEPVSLEVLGAEKIDCGACMGSGRSLAGGGENEICPICQGVGFHMIRRFDSADRICPACGGMGRVEMPDTGAVDTCPRCDGRGLIRNPPRPDSAPDGN